MIIDQNSFQASVYQFCIVKTVSKMFSSKLTFEVDLGQDADANTTYSAINHKTKKVSEFNNQVDALNYLSALGWEIVNISYQELSGTTYNNPEYLLKRRV
jgi:N-dimethylarginine dimethylaminohydrolase